jgi:hypothetical protein
MLYSDLYRMKPIIYFDAICNLLNNTLKVA